MGRRFPMKWSWSGLPSWVWADVGPLPSPSSTMPRLCSSPLFASPPPPHSQVPRNKKIVKRLASMKWDKKKLKTYSTLSSALFSSNPQSENRQMLQLHNCCWFLSRRPLNILSSRFGLPAPKWGVWNTLRWPYLLVTKGAFYLKPFLLLLYFCLIL